MAKDIDDYLEEAAWHEKAADEHFDDWVHDRKDRTAYRGALLNAQMATMYAALVTATRAYHHDD